MTRKWKWRIHDWLNDAFERHPGFERLFGLGQPVNKFYVRALRRVERIGPQGRLLPQAVLQITQTQRTNSAYITGGATLIVNTTTPGIDYVILKNVTSAERRDQAEKRAVGLAENSLRATYFGADSALGEPFAIVHEREYE